MTTVATELLFMPDYGADPIWDAATNCMVSLDRLPIDEQTRTATREWATRWGDLAWRQTHFDDVENGMLPRPAKPVPPQAMKDIERAGRPLCQLLREELGDRWRVVWVSFHHDRRHVQSEPDGPFTLFLPTQARPSRPA